MVNKMRNKIYGIIFWRGSPKHIEAVRKVEDGKVSNAFLTFDTLQEADDWANGAEREAGIEGLYRVISLESVHE